MQSDPGAAEQIAPHQWFAQLIVHLSIPVFLFSCAGDIRWWQAWIFSVLFVTAGVGGRIWATGWVVSDVAFCSAGGKIPNVAKRLRWRAHKIYEPGMPCADEPPEQPHADDNANRVSRPDVLGKKVVLCQVCGEEGDHEYPVPYSNDRVPDFHGVVRRIHFDSPMTNER